MDGIRWLSCGIYYANSVAKTGPLNGPPLRTIIDKSSSIKTDGAIMDKKFINISHLL